MLGLSLDPLYKAVGFLLAFFYALPPHNLGLAIILMTIVVMAVQFPLIAKQTRSMIQMQKVQPEIKKIQQKYKDDRQKQNEELLKFYQENSINPLAGCLPLLIVFPIGMAVFRSFHQGAVIVTQGGKVTVEHPYRGLQGHIPRTGPFSGLYADLCGGKLTPVPECAKTLKLKPPHTMYFLGMNLNWSAREVSSKLSGHFIEWLPYYLLIALVIFTGWYQVRQTQARQLKQGNQPPNQQMQTITRIMPVFFGLITFTLNAATTLYFVISNVWRIGQTHFVLNKMYDEAVEAGEIKAPKPAKAEPSDATPPPPKSRPPAARGGGPQDRTTKPPRDSNGAGARSPNAARRKKKRKR